ncbi:MAG: Fe-S protein assembly co-chaperone HscB [Vicinamibacterales bacterium]
MTSSTQAVSIQACKHCGTGAPPNAHFCPHCEKILAVARHGDYFSFFGLPAKLKIDRRDLDERLRTLSRQFHPDYFCNAEPAERLAALERSSYLNDAYRVLKDPVTRVEYLLKLECRQGESGVARGATGPDAAFLESIFAANEKIDAVRAAREAGAPADEVRKRLDEARRPIEEKRATHDRRLEALAAEWDAQVDAGVPAADRRRTLEALRAWLVEHTYIANLLAAVDRETDAV